MADGQAVNARLSRRVKKNGTRQVSGVTKSALEMRRGPRGLAASTPPSRKSAHRENSGAGHISLSTRASKKREKKRGPLRGDLGVY